MCVCVLCVSRKNGDSRNVYALWIFNRPNIRTPNERRIEWREKSDQKMHRKTNKPLFSETKTQNRQNQLVNVVRTLQNYHNEHTGPNKLHVFSRLLSARLLVILNGWLAALFVVLSEVRIEHANITTYDFTYAYRRKRILESILDAARSKERKKPSAIPLMKQEVKR